MMDEDWLSPFRVSDFTRTVWRYCHVFTGYEQTGRKFLSMAGVDGMRTMQCRGCTFSGRTARRITTGRMM